LLPALLLKEQLNETLADRVVVVYMAPIERPYLGLFLPVGLVDWVIVFIGGCLVWAEPFTDLSVLMKNTALGWNTEPLEWPRGPGYGEQYMKCEKRLLEYC